MQGKIADMYTALQSSRVFGYRVADNCEKYQVSRCDTAACLLFASENVVIVFLLAIQSLGGNGYINYYPKSSLLRDTKMDDISEGNKEILRMLIGYELFDESA